MKNRIAVVAMTLLIVLIALSILMFVSVPKVAGVEQVPQQATSTIAEAVVKEILIPQALLDISKCESDNTQFNKDGSVKRGIVNPQDVGRWQINEKYWLEKSKSLGFDIYTADGNRDMAIWIYNNYGAKPWAWSAPCHKHY